MSEALWIAIVGVTGTVVAGVSAQVVLYVLEGKREEKRWEREESVRETEWKRQRADSWFDQRRTAYVDCMRLTRIAERTLATDIALTQRLKDQISNRTEDVLAPLAQVLVEVEVMGEGDISEAASVFNNYFAAAHDLHVSGEKLLAGDHLSQVHEANNRLRSLIRKAIGVDEEGMSPR